MAIVPPLTHPHTHTLPTTRANPALGRVLRRDNFCSDSSGRANNWAMGFDASLRELEKGEGLFHSGAGVRLLGPTICRLDRPPPPRAEYTYIHKDIQTNQLIPKTTQTAVETLRREMERVDSLQGVVLHHSLAGGTGSGLGSAMLQYLRKVAPALNLSAWVFLMGRWTLAGICDNRPSSSVPNKPNLHTHHSDRLRRALRLGGLRNAVVQRRLHAPRAGGGRGRHHPPRQRPAAPAPPVPGHGGRRWEARAAAGGGVQGKEGIEVGWVRAGGSIAMPR